MMPQIPLTRPVGNTDHRASPETRTGRVAIPIAEADVVHARALRAPRALAILEICRILIDQNKFYFDPNGITVSAWQRCQKFLPSSSSRDDSKVLTQ